MSIIVDKIDEVFNNILQKNVVLSINQKRLKQGKLLLYSHSYFCYILHIKNIVKNKKSVIKIPYPFEYIKDEKTKSILFDYRLKTFCDDIPIIEELVEKLNIQNTSKFFDNILEIKIE